MSVVHFVRRGPFPAFHQAADGIALCPFRANGDSPLVARLADALPPSGPKPTPTGLGAELSSRPGRRVQAWLAKDARIQADGPLGLVTLVAASTPGVARHSVAWLLVHPDARRRGVGRALVAEACWHAGEIGATEVSVECLATWHEAIAFWRAVGFDDAGCSPVRRPGGRWLD